jgi:hypothetical protein
MCVQIASVLEEAWAPEYAYIGVIIDVDAIEKLQVSSVAFCLEFYFQSLIISWNSP